MVNKEDRAAQSTPKHVGRTDKAPSKEAGAAEHPPETAENFEHVLRRLLSERSK